MYDQGAGKIIYRKFEMAQQYINLPISVDSETGEYWHGELNLQNQAQVNAVVKLALNKPIIFINNHTEQEQSLIQYAALNIIRTTASYFEVRSFQFASQISAWIPGHYYHSRPTA